MHLKRKHIIVILLTLISLVCIFGVSLICGEWKVSPDSKQLAYVTYSPYSRGGDRWGFFFGLDFGVRCLKLEPSWKWSPNSQYILTEYLSLIGHLSGKVVELKTNETICEFDYLTYGGYNPCGLIKLENGELWSPAFKFYPGGLDEPLFVRQIMEWVYLITHVFPWPANSLLVRMADGTLVLVDTPYTPEATQKIISWIEKRFGTKDIVAINTGYHYDNLGGNAALLEQGIPVYGSDLTAQLLAERGDALRAMTLDWLQDPADRAYYDAHAALPYVAPDHTFALESGLTLTFGDETVEVFFPGPTHAPDNVVVYFPERKLLFGGCMIIGGDKVGNTSDADMAAWPESLRTLERFDVDVVVPGHGVRVDVGLIEHTVELLVLSGR